MDKVFRSKNKDFLSLFFFLFIFLVFICPIWRGFPQAAAKFLKLHTKPQYSDILFFQRNGVGVVAIAENSPFYNGSSFIFIFSTSYHSTFFPFCPLCFFSFFLQERWKKRKGWLSAVIHSKTCEKKDKNQIEVEKKFNRCSGKKLFSIKIHVIQ